MALSPGQTVTVGLFQKYNRYLSLCLSFIYHVSASEVWPSSHSAHTVLNLHAFFIFIGFAHVAYSSDY